MITVMFSSGVRVTYNDANDVTFESNRIDLCFKDDKGNRFYRASLPLSVDCLIEWRQPCTIVASPIATVKSALEFVIHELNRSDVKGWDEMRLLCELKRKLTRLDARKKVWR